MNTLEDNHPALLTGRRHARDVLASASRVVKATTGAKTSDQASVLSTALQLVTSAALVDEFDPHEAYEASSAYLAWLICRLPREDQLGVLTAMTTQVVERVRLGNAAPVAVN